MKTLWMLLIIGLMANPISAQSMETVFGHNGPRVGGAYGAAAQKFSNMDGQFAHFLGGYGGILFDSDVMLGAGAYALLNGQSIDINQDPGTFRTLTYTGLMVERLYHSSKLIHLTANLLIGAAFIGEQDRIPGGGTYYIRARGGLVAEPMTGIEVNLTKWFRASLGVSYRWVSGPNNYSGLASTGSLKFGKF